MNLAGLIESLDPLPRSPRVRLASQLDRLQRVCRTNCPLEELLRQAVEITSRIFGASAGAFWLQTPGSEDFAPVVRQGFSGLALTPTAETAFAATVQQSAAATEPFWGQLPADEPAAHDWSVLVGPLRDNEKTVGALQLVLGTKGKTADAPSDNTALTRIHGLYSQALGGTMSIIQPAVVQRLRQPPPTLAQAELGLQRVGQQIAGIQRTIRLTIERYLQQFNGVSFASLEENQQFARDVQQLLEAHALRVRCPECGHPAILRCSRNASSPNGVFVFDHYLPEGRTFHGGVRTLPLLRTVSKPARKQAAASLE